MRIAYLILAHKNPSQLAELVMALDDPTKTRFYIHVDQRSADFFGSPSLKPIMDRENVLFLRDRVRVYWGGFSIVEATLRLIRKLREVALEEYFVLPGHVENVDEYYRAADISMFTGYNDGFGYTVLEAMRHSLSVVAFASGGPAEIIKDGVSGLLINETDAKKFVSGLMALIDNSERRSLMGQRAHQVVEEEFSRDTWIERVMDALRAIVVSVPVRDP